MEDFKNLAILLEKFGAETIAKMILILKNGGKSDSNFIRLIKSTIEYEDSVMRLSLFLPDYWVFIEGGRGPNKRMPPREPIIGWMRRKAIPEKFEYPIRRRIGIRGIKPLPFIHIWYDNVSVLNQKMAETAAIDLEKMVSEYIKNNI